MSHPVDFDSIPEKMKASICWAVWKTEETESGFKQKVPYCTHKKHVNTDNPETWLSFSESLLLLARYPEFEGLCFFKSADLGVVPGWQNTVTEAVYQVCFKIRDLRTFLKSEDSYRRGGCQ